MSAQAATMRGYDPLKDKSYSATRLGIAVVDFLAWMRLGGTAARTLDQYERDLSRACLMYPDKGIEDITDGDMLHIAGQFKPAERRVRVAAYKSFFKWALRRRLIHSNPCDALPEMRVQKQRVIAVFTDDETDRLLALPVVDAAPLAILLEAGLRKGEARALRFRDCLPESGMVTVYQGKGSRDRVVPMTGRLKSLLAELAIIEAIGANEFVFYRTHDNQHGHKRKVRDKPVGEGTFARWWRRCLDDAAVRYRTPHTARHSYATRWRRMGLAIDEIQILLGHSSIRTTSDLYVHTAVADVAEHMRIIESSRP